jgi:hypothetical protein
VSARRCDDSEKKIGYEYGLFATKNLPSLSAIQHNTGVYNIQISTQPNIYIIADRIEHTGPGAFGKDNTVLMYNAQILCHIPDEHYLHNGAVYKNNGQLVSIFIEITQNVDTLDEIFISYGDRYWTLPSC